jgi:hypothetical protein
MAEVHQLILLHGVEEARRQAVTKHERLIVDAAYQVLSDDAEKMGFTYSGFALTSLPHKPQAETVWRREGHTPAHRAISRCQTGDEARGAAAPAGGPLHL